MTKPIRMILIFFCFLILAGIRYFQEDIFYDPLISFFHTDYQSADLPEMDQGKLMINLGFRFWLNTLVSLFALWFAYQDKRVVQFSTVLYAIAFVVLIGIFYYQMMHYQAGEYMALFYTRRFLIQPVLLLLLLPAFYFQKRS